MAHHVVWKIIKRRDMPVRRQCVKSKWVFKIKQIRVFCARLVACGDSQIPGIDFTDKYVPVVKDVILCVLLLVWLQFKLTAKKSM